MVSVSVRAADNTLPDEAVAEPSAIPAEGDVWDGSTIAPSKFVQKDGEDYYELTQCVELAYVRSKVTVEC